MPFVPLGGVETGARWVRGSRHPWLNNWLEVSPHLLVHLELCSATTADDEADAQSKSEPFRLGTGNNQNVLKELESPENRRSNLRVMIQESFESLGLGTS